MFFKNPVGGIVPNFPVQLSIVQMHREVAELHGELKAAGCEIVQHCGDIEIKVPAGIDIQPIMDKHMPMFNKGAQ